MLDEQGYQWCDRCAGPIPDDGHGGYVVRVEAFADPEPRAVGADLSRREIRDLIRKTIEALAEMSGQEAMDQVYRRFEFYLCPACHRAYIEDPLYRDASAGGE